MKSIFVALFAVILVGCGAGEAPTDSAVSAASAPPCDASDFAVDIGETKLTPYVREQVEDCSIPDDPTLRDRVWCCPISK